MKTNAIILLLYFLLIACHESTTRDISGYTIITPETVTKGNDTITLNTFEKLHYGTELLGVGDTLK